VHEEMPDRSKTPTTESEKAPAEQQSIAFHNGPEGAQASCPPEEAEKYGCMSRPSFNQGSLSQKIADLQRAYNSQVVYVVGKEQVRISPQTNFARRILLQAFLWLRENTRSKVQALNVGVDRLVEVGFVKQVL
jgi:hypothetical protein